MIKHILLFGATGDTGSALLNQALEKGLQVRVAEREIPDDFKQSDNVEMREADLLDGGLADLMDGVDCVISAVGLPRDPQTLINPPPLYTEGAVNIVSAMRDHGIKRFITISAVFYRSQRNRAHVVQGSEFSARQIISTDGRDGADFASV